MNQDRTSTITNSQLKEGYKQTEIGIIPEDWEIIALGEILSFQNGVNADKKAYGVGIPFINVLEVITHPRLTVDLIPGKVSLTSQITKTFKVESGDVLFNRTSETQEEVGLASVYLDKADVVFGGFVIRGKPTKDYLDAIFCSYILRFPSIHSQISSRGQGAVRANIGQKELSKVKVCVPLKSEQEAIASTLRDIDALIESLDRLLTKKRQIKQGAMQELLRSKDGWVERKLSEIADIRSGGTPSTSRYEFWDGDILWCTPTDITALKGYKYLFNTSRLITLQGLNSSSAEMIPVNSIVMTSRATIGECAINKFPVSTNQGFKNFIPFDDVDVEFLYYLLQTQKQRFISLCGGSTFLEISKNQLTEFIIELPESKTNQIEIANVLSDMDAEIGSIESKLTKTRQLKQGMMHELLTGRIRLVEQISKRLNP